MKIFPGLYLPVLCECEKSFVIGPNSGKYGPEITPYLEISHAVCQGMQLNNWS